MSDIVVVSQVEERQNSLDGFGSSALDVDDWLLSGILEKSVTEMNVPTRDSLGIPWNHYGLRC
jgi:hypothetical protein